MLMQIWASMPGCRDWRRCGVPAARIAAGLLFCTFLGATCAAAQSPSAAGQGATNAAEESGSFQGSSNYHLGSGDRVHIVVFGQKDLTGNYPVDGTGRIAFPLIGEVQAGGLTAQQLAQEIANDLNPEYLRNPKVSAEVLSYRPFYILGEVTKPGSYPYVSGMTVINAVALAGGFTPRAKENDFSVTRTEMNGKRVELDANQNTPVAPGDVITVPERWF